MKKIIRFFVVIFIIAMLGLLVYANIWAMVNDYNLDEAKRRLRSVAETGFATNDGSESVISKDLSFSPDPWGTEVRLLYLKAENMTISLAISAGRDGVWETEDDLSSVVYCHTETSSSGD